MSERTLFLLEMAGVACVGIALIVGASVAEDAWHWFEPLGEAVVVAALLGATVDPYLKRQLTEEMFGSTLRAIFGKGLPKPVQEEMRRIANFNIVREQYLAEYRLGKVAEGWVEVVTQVEFIARNIASEDEEFIHTLRIQDAEAGEVTRLRCVGCGDDDYDDRGDAVKAELFEGGWLAKRTVTLPGGKTAKFRGETARRLPVRWDDVMYFSHPTIGVRIRVFSPSEISVKLLYMHDSPAASQVSEQNEIELENVAFLPNMSFMVKWRPAAVSASSGKVDQTARRNRRHKRK